MTRPASASPDLIFAALANASRRQMLDLLVTAPGMSVKAMASHFDMSRIAVMKHLATLESANLLLSERDGRTRRLYFNPIPIQEVYDRWTNKYSSFWSERMTDLQARVEARATSRSKKNA